MRRTIRRFLRRWRRKTVKVMLVIGPFLSLRNTTEVLRMGVKIPVDQKAQAKLNPKDSKGNPGRVDGVPVWASSDETLLRVVPTEDGMAAFLVPVGPVGTAQATVTADADLGEGVKPVTGLVDVECIGGTVVDLGVNVGPLEPQ